MLLLWVIALGLLALAIWQITEAVLERNPDTKKKWGYRIKYIGTAVVYLAIAWTALVYALGGESDSSEASQSFSAQMLATPAGVFVLVLIGLIIGGVGIAFIVRGLTRGFEKHLALPDEPAETGIVTFGVVGYVAKGIAITIAGALFVIAAVTHDPEKAGWLDAALHALAALPVRRRHSVDRGCRARDLRTLLLRPLPLREDVTAARPTCLGRPAAKRRPRDSLKCNHTSTRCRCPPSHRHRTVGSG